MACSPLASPPAADTTIPGEVASQIVRERLSAVVVTRRNELGSWVNQRFSMENAPKDADGGSAAPITEDGYFLTADHVLARASGRNVFIIYGNGGRITTSKARIVWRSYHDDLAILHIPVKTTYFYKWTPPHQWLSPGRGIIHGGMATGFKSSPGRLRSALPPENSFTGNRSFKIDIPLQPGDSGGPVVDAFGNLVGINSAVEFLVPLETAIFIDSEGNRPNTKKIAGIIQKDRNNNYRN
ncbi:serine protease [Luteolibacter algae]|uniref:Serine protease n=1 Tax=Luteolibacter algae TaxID=454151 RepID=A0ABW5D2C4_9BACT